MAPGWGADSVPETLSHTGAINRATTPRWKCVLAPTHFESLGAGLAAPFMALAVGTRLALSPSPPRRDQSRSYALAQMCQGESYGYGMPP